MTSTAIANEITHQEWLEERRTGLGSSDAAPICGLSPWTTPLHVWSNKLGLIPDEEPTPAMRWGTRMEPVIADAYREIRDGVELLKPPLRRHADLPWMIANVDRLSDDGRIVELKTCNPFAAHEWGEPGTDQVPEYYIVQVMHQMAVYRSFGELIEVADIPVLIGGFDFRVYTVPWNQALAEQLIQIEAYFWSLVESRTQPAPDWEHPATPKLVQKLRGTDGSTINLDEKALALAMLVELLGEREKDHKRRRDIAKAQLTQLMGTAAIGLCPDGTTIARKQIHRRAYNVSASSYYTLTVKRPEGRNDSTSSSEADGVHSNGGNAGSC